MTADQELFELSPPNTPSEAYAAGWCPSCLGRGRVHSVIHDEERDCSACNGLRTLEAMQAVQLRNLFGLCAYGDTPDFCVRHARYYCPGYPDEEYR